MSVGVAIGIHQHIKILPSILRTKKYDLYATNLLCKVQCTDIFNQEWLYNIQKQVELIKIWRDSFCIKNRSSWTLYFIEIRYLIAQKSQNILPSQKSMEPFARKLFLNSSKNLGLQTIICKISNHPCAKKNDIIHG